MEQQSITSPLSYNLGLELKYGENSTGVEEESDRKADLMDNLYKERLRL